MAYNFEARYENVYSIDAEMFGFKEYQSCFIVAGKKLALIDAGAPLSLNIVKQAIRKHGFSIADIDYVFVTHTEHPDHAGNVGALLKENSKAKVYINAAGEEYLTHPEIEAAKRKALLLPVMAARFGIQEPVDVTRILRLKDGQEFDLGDGEILKIKFAPGHQPSGIVIFEEKNQGLFINDLVGLCFPDADVSLILTPYRSDIRQTLKYLKELQKMSFKRLYLGHFGIQDNTKQVIQKAIDGIQRLLDIGEQCLREGKPEDIEPRVYASKLGEVEKLTRFRGKVLGEYVRDELNTHHATAFKEYYLSNRSS